MNHEKPLLIIGIGNSGRADDGLGWAFCDQLSSMLIGPLEIAYRYQLQIEDASYIADFEKVVMIDATCEREVNSVKWEKVKPKQIFEFSTHALSPETVVSLCRQLYDKTPKVYLLSIRGEIWDLEVGLSNMAKTNLGIALEKIKTKVPANVIANEMVK